MNENKNMNVYYMLYAIIQILYNNYYYNNKLVHTRVATYVYCIRHKIVKKIIHSVIKIFNLIVEKNNLFNVKN